MKHHRRLMNDHQETLIRDVQSPDPDLQWLGAHAQAGPASAVWPTFLLR